MDSICTSTQYDYRANPLRIMSQISAIVDMNGSTDYLEIFVDANVTGTITCRTVKNSFSVHTG